MRTLRDIYYVSARKVMLFLWVVSAGLYAQEFKKTYTELENAVYAELDTTEVILSLYEAACNTARQSSDEAVCLAQLSQCEELLGRWYLVQEDNDHAAECFDRGIEYAQQSIKISPTADAHAALASNTSQNMRTKSVGYMIKNGLKMQSLIDDALQIDPYNAAATYLRASTYVYAPKAFTNAKKGREIALQMLSDTNYNLSKAQTFNVYTALAQAEILDKNYTQARLYLQQGADLFPSNSSLKELEREIQE